MTRSTSLWRIVKARYAAFAFDGKGAQYYGGRWNHDGFPVVYTADTLALAALELFVHLDGKCYFELMSIKAQIPSSLFIETLEDLPPHWNMSPAGQETKDMGTEWLKAARSVILRVPSAVIPSEYNYLLNPRHPDFIKLKLEDPRPFYFDPRMWKVCPVA